MYSESVEILKEADCDYCNPNSGGFGEEIAEGENSAIYIFKDTNDKFYLCSNAEVPTIEGQVFFCPICGRDLRED